MSMAYESMATAAFAREEAAPRPRVDPAVLANTDAMFGNNFRPMTALNPDPAATQPRPMQMVPEPAQVGGRKPRGPGERESSLYRAKRLREEEAKKAAEASPYARKPPKPGGGGGGGTTLGQVSERTGERGHGGTRAPHNA